MRTITNLMNVLNINDINPRAAGSTLMVMATLLVVNISSAWAQNDAPMDHRNHEAMSAPANTSMDMPGMNDKAPTMDHSSMDHSTMNHSTDNSVDSTADSSANSAMDHSTGHSMDHGNNRMQGGSAPSDARDPHAYSGGYDFGPMPRLRLADEYNFGAFMMNRFEAVRSDDNTWATYDFQARYGRDYNRVVLKAEGDIDSGTLEEGTTELLWGHAVDTFWDAQLGVRHDSGEGPNRSWLAIGAQGLAPYWFEMDATFYIGDEGRTALALEAEYELLITQKLILQPRLEANVYGKNDAERALGSGLSDIAVGIRLRYEVRREFAPYVGIEWIGRFGDTADYLRAAGESKDETTAVAGVRFWF